MWDPLGWGWHRIEIYAGVFYLKTFGRWRAKRVPLLADNFQLKKGQGGTEEVDWPKKSLFLQVFGADPRWLQRKIASLLGAAALCTLSWKSLVLCARLSIINSSRSCNYDTVSVNWVFWEKCVWCSCTQRALPVKLPGKCGWTGLPSAHTIALEMKIDFFWFQIIANQIFLLIPVFISHSAKEQNFHIQISIRKTVFTIKRRIWIFLDIYQLLAQLPLLIWCILLWTN